MKRFLCIAIALALAMTAAGAELAVDGRGNPFIEYEAKEVWDQILFRDVTVRGILSNNGNSSFDFERFSNSSYGRSYAELMAIGLKNGDPMGEGMLDYFRSVGVSKARFQVDEADEKTAYYVYSPLEPEEGKTYPLVVCSHGAGSDARSAEVYGWCEMAGSEGLITVIPELVEVESLHTMIEQVKAVYPVDESRVYMVGNSRGGMMSRAYAGAYPTEIAGIGPVSNSFVFVEGTDGDPEQLKALGMPTIFVGGTADVYNVLYLQPGAGMIGGSVEQWNNLVKLHGAEEWCTTQEEYDARYLRSQNVLERFTGLRLPEPKVYDYVNAQAFQCDFPDESGLTTLSVVVADNHPHFMLKEDSEIIWAFLSQFARNTETGELIVLGE